MDLRSSRGSLRVLFWITIANYAAQIPYYLYGYYFPYHVLPSFSAVVLLGATLVWFLTGYFGIIAGWKYGRLCLASFLSAEALFYLLTCASGAFASQMQNPHLIIKTVFIMGYVSGCVAGYFLYRLMFPKKI